MDPEECFTAKRSKKTPKFYVVVIPRNVARVGFGHGDPVLIRPKTRREFSADKCFGTFDKLVESKDESAKMAWIRFESSFVQQVPCHRLFPVLKGPLEDSAQVSVRVVYDTASFRRMAWAQLQSTTKEHHVLELGCSTGETSEIIWSQATSWVGLDTSSEMIQRVQEKISMSQQNSTMSSKLYCERLDALVDPSRAEQVACTFHEKGPTDVFLDIGGDRSEKTILKMLHFLCVDSTFSQLEQIIIKSEELHTSLWKELKLDDNEESFHLSRLFFERDEAWFQEKIASHTSSPFGESIQILPKHPLKAPLRLSPSDGKTPICRFHNYHPDGCSRFRDNACPYDHSFCHLCLKPGHVARQCRTTTNPY